MPDTYINPAESVLYYLNSRYYDPEVGRFINADGYVATGQGISGFNMFVYCGNNPVSRIDPSGKFWVSTLMIMAIVTCIIGLSGCSSRATNISPRSDLAKAPNLDINKADSKSYNCYGNGIGKQINTNPTGYKTGDSTAKTYEAVKKDLGGDKNVRRLDSINASVNTDEFKVAMKCGPMDYHFIRLDSEGWYNKSGTAPGLFIDQSIVAGDIWYAMWMNNGKAYYSKDVFYDDETIYFAVKVGWDVE